MSSDIKYFLHCIALKQIKQTYLRVNTHEREVTENNEFKVVINEHPL